VFGISYVEVRVREFSNPDLVLEREGSREAAWGILRARIHIQRRAETRLK